MKPELKPIPPRNPQFLQHRAIFTPPRFFPCPTNPASRIAPIKHPGVKSRIPMRGDHADGAKY